MTAIRVGTWNLWWRFGDRWDGATWRPDNPAVAARGEPPSRVDHVLLGLGRGRVPVGVEGVGLFGTGPWGGVWPSDHAGVAVDLRTAEPAA